MIFAVLFVLGLVIGFVGAGGAGVVIAVLTVMFGIPIHMALGTSLSAMVFTTLSGAYSHFKEGNVVVQSGAAVGIFGAMGSFIGAHIAALIPAQHLTWLTAGMLFLSAFLLLLRVFFFSKEVSSGAFSGRENKVVINQLKFWLAAGGLGIVTGLLSGTFGIGAAPFIQIGLLVLFNMSIVQSAGTTMLVILPIALLGGFGYLTAGYLDVRLFIQVTAGLMIGAYIGAKFTKRLHPAVLKTATVILPALGGLLLLLGPKH